MISAHRSRNLRDARGRGYYHNDINKLAECREKIRDASHLLLELINEVLDMGKLESGEIMLEEVPFNLYDIGQNVLKIIEKNGGGTKNRNHPGQHWSCPLESDRQSGSCKTYHDEFYK